MLGTALKPSKDAMTVELFPSTPRDGKLRKYFYQHEFSKISAQQLYCSHCRYDPVHGVFAATAGYVIARKSTFFFKAMALPCCFFKCSLTILLLLPLFLIFKNLGLVNSDLLFDHYLHRHEPAVFHFGW